MPLPPPVVAARLIMQWSCADGELRALLESSRDRDFTHTESIQHTQIVRRIAVLSSALHGDMTIALTDDERAWLAMQYDEKSRYSPASGRLSRARRA
jgi:adenylate kinase